MEVRNLILTGGTNHNFIVTAKAPDEDQAHFLQQTAFWCAGEKP
jgi:hypothetical protein|tara:strand:- start:38 stop:169 length:132 start_codon:yes stop_codon:yes gene_type:complete